MVKQEAPNKKRYERGQALILIALTFVVLLAFIGLAMDAGQLFIAMGSLRRAADAGALAAAAQFREGQTVGAMEAAAREAIALNGMNPGTVTIELCDPANPDPEICPPAGQPLRKMVRVTAQAQVPLSFLSVIGIRNLTISTTAVSEAASMDVVLVIDTSESMAFDAPVGNPLRDPHYCNSIPSTGGNDLPGECQPFQKVKESAISFVEKILDKPAADEEDRVAIVSFADGFSNNLNLGTHFQPYGTPYWTNDINEARTIIRNLKVYDPGICADNTWMSGWEMYGACRNYSESTGEYQGLYCDYCNPGPDPWNNETYGTGHEITDWSPYMTTNIGGGLLKGGSMFSEQTREDALWIVILLTDGLANATDYDTGDNIQSIYSYPIGHCPDWANLCQDNDTRTRHDESSALYDADDYARDMADFVACAPLNPKPGCATEGQGAVIFTIGLGDEVINNYQGKPAAEVNGIPYGASLLRYIAQVGIDSDPDPGAASDPCLGETDYTAWCGNYYFSPGGSELYKVFEDIASRIFTRLTH